MTEEITQVGQNSRTAEIWALRSWIESGKGGEAAQIEPALWRIHNVISRSAANKKNREIHVYSLLTPLNHWGWFSWMAHFFWKQLMMATMPDTLPGQMQPTSLSFSQMAQTSLRQNATESWHEKGAGSGPYSTWQPRKQLEEGSPWHSN